MARNKPTPAKTPDLPGVAGPGVSALNIPSIAKAVEKYEQKKKKRCEASPGEIAAKNDLKQEMVANRDRLPVNEDGLRFYRHEGVDYILEEKLTRHAVDGEGDE